MTPPPLPIDMKHCGSCRSLASQSIIITSSSMATGQWLWNSAHTATIESIWETCALTTLSQWLIWQSREHLCPTLWVASMLSYISAQPSFMSCIYAILWSRLCGQVTHVWIVELGIISRNDIDHRSLLSHRLSIIIDYKINAVVAEPPRNLHHVYFWKWVCSDPVHNNSNWCKSGTT